MNELYIVAQEWQLDSIRKLLKDGETLGTNSYCFRPNTYVITHEGGDERSDVLAAGVANLGANVPLQ